MINWRIALTLIVLLYITQRITIYFHELAHKKELDKENIKNKIKKQKSSFLGYSKGRCHILNYKKYNELSYKTKKKILLSGIYSDLIFIFIFLFGTIFSWIYLKNTIIWYYLNLSLIFLILNLLLNLFKKDSDGRKILELKNERH